MIRRNLTCHIAYRTKENINIDGHLDEKLWELAALKSPRFVDIITGKPALYDIRSAVLSNDDYLYIGF